MSAELYLEVCLVLSFALLSAALILASVRLSAGPSLPDRILALDLLMATIIGVIAAWAMWTGHPLFVDVAIILGIAALLSTVALCRLLLRRGDSTLEEREEEERS